MKEELKDVKRIAIVGGPGTGKTTLAQKLSEILKLPALHLDSVNFKRNWEKIDDKTRDSIILEKAKEEYWIIDGNYVGTLPKRLERADLVILLDYSTASIIKGVLERTIRNLNKEKKELPGCKERISWHFLKYMITFRKKKRKQIKENINKIWEYIKNQNQISAKIFYLYFVLEMTFKDISKELNLKESTVKTNLYRMVKKVKEAFGGERLE